MPVFLSSKWNASLTAALFLLAAAIEDHACATQPQVINPGEVLRGHFVLDRQLSGFARSLHTTGAFSLIPGQGLIWQAQTPFKDVTVITADGILVRTNGQEAIRLPSSRIPGIGHLYEILSSAVSGNIKPLGHDFQVTRSSDAGGWHLVLVPLRPRDLAASQIKSLIVSGHQFVENVEVDKDGGDIDHIGFLDQAVQMGPPTPEESLQLKALRP